MMEYWNDVEDKKTKILLYPLFHHSIIPPFQLRSEAKFISIEGGHTPRAIYDGTAGFIGVLDYWGILFSRLLQHSITPGPIFEIE